MVASGVGNKRAVQRDPVHQHMNMCVVRKIQWTNKAEFFYARARIVYPALGDFLPLLSDILEKEYHLPLAKRRRAKQIHEEPQRTGYTGSYYSVQRYVKEWNAEHKPRQSAFMPLVISKGEAFQFDGSEETVDINGLCVKVQVAHIRLCYRRMSFCMAFTRQRSEMLLHAHIKAHDFLEPIHK